MRRPGRHEATQPPTNLGKNSEIIAIFAPKFKHIRFVTHPLIHSSTHQPVNSSTHPLIVMVLAAFTFNTSEFIPVGLLTAASSP